MCHDYLLHLFLFQAFSSDDNNSMKFESVSPNKILIRNDVQGGEGPQHIQVHNNLIASPTSESMLVSNDKNEVDGALQMVRSFMKILTIIIKSFY